MQVTCGAEWQVSSGGRRNYAISLDIDDLTEIKGEEAVSHLTRKELLKELNKTADSLVVGYLVTEGAISREYAEQRLREIQHV